jgi:hypothetical protein
MPKLKLKAITPKHTPKTQEYLDALEKAAQKTMNLVRRDLQSTVRTWNHKPVFSVVIRKTGGTYTITAGTNDKIYGYVTEGTRAHVIRPKRSRYLRFSSGYRAKTRVGIIGSIPGGAFGDPVFAAEVNHPGFPGRKFIEKIQARRQKTIEQESRQSVAKVARKQR